MKNFFMKHSQGKTNILRMFIVSVPIAKPLLKTPNGEFE